MDTERALKRVDEMLELLETSENLENHGLDDDRREIDQQVRERLPLIEKIAEVLEPGLANEMQPRSFVGEWPWSSTREGLIRMRGLLSTQQEEQEILGPSGPKLIARRLHPTVWNAAAKLWDDGHRRAAIQAGGTAVDEALQAKLNDWSRSGADLMFQVFDQRPPSGGQARLRFAAFPAGSDTWRSAHEGAKFFGAGCMMRIRNLATHRTSEPDEDASRVG